LSDGGSGWDDDILDGIAWAVDQGARVISMSLGSARSPQTSFAVAYERIASHEPDILFVAATGNESRRPKSTALVGNPAACPSFLSVAAIDEQNLIASFSCCEIPPDQAKVDISGPGVAVHSAWLGSGFATIDGTSMATPHVAGVAALYAERQPGADAKTLWHALTARALPLGAPTDFGAGLVQV
jgi:subtilisin family serine protease